MSGLRVTERVHGTWKVLGVQGGSEGRPGDLGGGTQGDKGGPRGARGGDQEFQETKQGPRETQG